MARLAVLAALGAAMGLVGCADEPSPLLAPDAAALVDAGAPLADAGPPWLEDPACPFPTRYTDKDYEAPELLELEVLTATVQVGDVLRVQGRLREQGCGLAEVVLGLYDEDDPVSAKRTFPAQMDGERFEAELPIDLCRAGQTYVVQLEARDLAGNASFYVPGLDGRYARRNGPLSEVPIRRVRVVVLRPTPPALERVRVGPDGLVEVQAADTPGCPPESVRLSFGTSGSAVRTDVRIDLDEAGAGTGRFELPDCMRDGAPWWLERASLYSASGAVRSYRPVRGVLEDDDGVSIGPAPEPVTLEARTDALDTTAPSFADVEVRQSHYPGGTVFRLRTRAWDDGCPVSRLSIRLRPGRLEGLAPTWIGPATEGVNEACIAIPACAPADVFQLRMLGFANEGDLWGHIWLRAGVYEPSPSFSGAPGPGSELPPRTIAVEHY